MLELRLLASNYKHTPPFKSTLAVFGKGEKVVATEVVAMMKDQGDKGIWLKYNVDEPEQLFEMLEIVGLSKIPLLISTDSTDKEFYEGLGRYVTKKAGVDVMELVEAMMSTDDSEIMVMMGVTAIDQFVPQGYLIRFGSALNGKLSPGREHGVAIQTDNQRVFEVRRGDM